MTTEAFLAFALTGLALALFVWNRLRPDVVALIVAGLLLVTGLVTPAEGVSGFSNEATITVALMMVLSTGLLHTGAVDVLGRTVVRLAGKSEFRLLLFIVAAVVPLSAVINNTAAVAILLPALIGASRQIGAAPSRMLLPLSFAGQLGGALTLIGTSTNLLVAGLVLDLGLDRIRIFDITPPALVVAAVGVAYLLTVGRWLTPVRAEPKNLMESYELHDYVTFVRVRADSPLAGRTLEESRVGEKLGVQVLRIERPEGRTIAAPVGNSRLLAGDLAFVEGKVAEITALAEDAGLELRESDAHPLERKAEAEDEDEEAEDPVHFAEILVPPGSPARGRTVDALALRSRFRVSALALRRRGHSLRPSLGAIRLEPGDMLLVQGRASSLERLNASPDFALISALDLPPRRHRKMRWAVPIVGGVVALAAFDVLPIMVAALVGAVAMVLVGALTAEEAYQEMDWMAVVLLGAILPLGLALEGSGAASLAAGWLLDVARPLGPWGVLAAVYALTSLLTNMISNVAAAALLVPVATAVAASLSLSPMPFVVGVMFAASNAFLTPIGYQTNLFVLGPGGYRFTDFLRVGAPLTLLTGVTTVLAVPYFFPFEP